jgi:hypothetical protein
VVAKFQRPLLELLLEFGDAVLDGVRDAKGVNVDDVRHKMLGPLRGHVARMPPP